MSGIYGNGVSLVEKMLDFLWTRQEITLNNITNNDTPGFKSQYVSFEGELAARLQEASARGRAPGAAVSSAIDNTSLRLHTTQTESTKMDGNNVDMDQEQIDLVQTAYEYQYLVNSINNDLNRLRSVARSF